MQNIMNIFVYLFLVVLVTNRNGKAAINDEFRKLFLSVYYQTNCLESKTFVLKQLYPTIKMLHEYVALRLIPFGKSKSINQGANGFECPHGPTECQGNMVQDCTLAFMGHRSDVDRAAYVACEMATGSALKGSLACVRKAHVSVTRVQRCLKSKEGVELQLHSEFLTRLTMPRFIPTITVDGMYDESVQNDSLADLVGTLCSMMKESSACARYYNRIALNNLLYYPLNLKTNSTNSSE